MTKSTQRGVARSKSMSFRISKDGDKLSALFLKPKNASCLFLFAHGAGADMHHSFMESMAQELALLGVATLRYQFPYTERRSKRPDPKPTLLATVRSAVALANEISDGLPLFAGGKSMGGRMTSLAASGESLSNVAGLVFFGFPLHPAGEPSSERSAHLSKVRVPMLFLQGTRDALADLSLLKPICKKLGKRATLFVVEDADHSFHVPKRSGKSDEETRGELAQAVATWSTEATQ